MPPRPLQLEGDTTLILEDGTKIQTQYNSATKLHSVTCDMCPLQIILPATANTYRLDSHRKSCKRRQEKAAAKRFWLSDTVPPEPENNFDTRLLFNNTNLTQVECPGQWVPWPAGSIWASYPFQLHKSREIGWTPIGMDGVHNGIVVRANQCWKQVTEVDNDSPSPCIACRDVPHTAAFKTVAERAKDVKEHTPWMYLTDLQKERLMRQMAGTIRRLRARISSSVRSRRVLSNKIHEYKRIMMLIASNDIPRLTQLLSVSLCHGSSASAIVTQIQRAIDGLYSLRGGFTQRELDVAFLSEAMGGRRMLYMLGKSYGLASETTVRRRKLVPRLLPSVGVPTTSEIEHNISAFFDPNIKSPPTFVTDTPSLPGNILGFDGISIQKKCRYCPKRGVVLGLCREHSKNVNTNVTDSAILGELWDALEADDDSSKVCWGTEATVVVLAPYSRPDYYSPTPLVLSATDKSEKGEGLSQWIQTVIDTWNAHENGAEQNGPLWSIASDGDATFRQARSEICNRYMLDPTSPLGHKLYPLLGLNRYTSKELITATCDPKHIFKCFATLLRSTGVTIKNHLISSNDIREQLLEYIKLPLNEVNDILNTQDKQNVPKAVKLLRYLNTLPDVPPPVDEFCRLRYDHVCFIAKVFSFFVEPFVDVRMNLDDQLRSLSTFAHLAVVLQLEHGAACLTGPLYADTQATIKNIYFVVARLQLISPNLTFHLIHEGTDRLERLFGDCRTLDHGRNFDILQLSEKMAIATLINSTFERNPDLDRGHRRLDLSTTIGVDHVNPASWLGDTRVGQVDLTVVWNKGREVAVRLLESLFGVEKVQRDFDFNTIFSKSNRDILRPNGIYVGVRPTKDDDRSPVQNEPATPTQPALTRSLDDEELPLEDSLPDHPDEKLKTLQSFTVNGTEVKIDSALSTIHPNSWRQMSDRIFRVRGWNLDQFNTSKVEGLVDADDAINEELFKVYDIVGFLARVGDDVCLAVMEIKGFTKPEGRKKLFQLSAKCSDLASTTSNVKVLGQIIKLVPSEKQSDYWEWAREYVVPNSNSKGREKKQSFTIEVSSHLILPLMVNMISYPSEPRRTRLRWALSTEDLQRQMLSAWDTLSPEFSPSNFESIPIIKNANGLPYENEDGQKSFTVKSIPNYVFNRNIPLSPKKLVHCLLCGIETQLNMMRGHVGKHILWDMRGQMEETSSSISSMGIMPCGFCGTEGCTTNLAKAPNGGAAIITSNCIYYDASLDYQAASKGKASGTLCSNVPIHCSLCPPSPEGDQRTIWKYNALMHILVDHEEFHSEDPNLCTLPNVPISMQVQMHILRAEEAALGIKEESTLEARADFNLLDSDDLPKLPEDWEDTKEIYSGLVGKRSRSETQSTVQSAISPPFKKRHP